MLRLTNRINNEQEMITNMDSRVIADRQNIRRLDNEMARQEQFANSQEFFNSNVKRSHKVNIAIFVLLGVLILVILVVASMAYAKASNATFPENSISAQELDNNDSFTFKNLNLTGGGNSTLTIENPGGITFGSSQITADEFRVIDGAIAGTVIASKAVVVDANRNIHGFGYITAGGASFSDGVCFKNLVTAEAGMSVLGGTSFSNLARFYDGLCVLGGTSFNNLTNFYGGINVGGALYSYGGLSVSGITNFSNLVTVESNTGLSVQGGISLSGAINLYSQLNSVEGICILGGLSVSGVTQLYGETRIAKIISSNTTDIADISTGHLLTKDQSGHEFFVDYSNNTHINFVLPELTSTDTGHNYKFLWTDGPSSGDKYAFSLIANDVISGTVREFEKTTNNMYVISSDSANDHYRLDLNTTTLEGSKLSAKSYKGRWLVEGDIGIIAANNAVDTFNNHSIKEWIVVQNRGILFSNDADNWYNAYHLPPQIVSSAGVLGVAFANLSDGTSLFVASCGNTGVDSRNMIYSNTGTSWQFATGQQFNGINSNTTAKDVAFGQDNLGNDLWVAAGEGSGGVNNIIFSTNGTCWMNSHTGSTFSTNGYGVAFGTDGAGSCLWAAAGLGTYELLWSSDGMCWAPSVSSGTTFNEAGFKIAYGTDNLGNPRWVACGFDISNSYNCILWSNDGMCWAKSSSAGIAADSDIVFDVAYGVSSDGTCLWVAGSNDTVCAIFRSVDGMSWTRASNSTFNLAGKLVYSVAYGVSNGSPLWTAVINSSSNNIIHSVDGLNWYLGDLGAKTYFPNAITYSRPLYPNRNNIIDNIYT
jgi:hypothetical protein